MAIGFVSATQSSLLRQASLTKVSVDIDGATFRDLQEYTIDSNVLTLMDSFHLQIADPGGLRPLVVQKGQLVKISMSDPRVAGGEERQILIGRVIDVERSIDENGGCVVDVTGGDLGWHLVNTPGPLFKSVMSIEFKKFIELILDSTWGFAGFATDNDFNRQLQRGLKLNQSRAGIAAARAPEDVFIPPVCFEAGEMIADKLITYARRARRLVNVSGDGYLQIYKPNYSQAPAFTLHCHRRDEADRIYNNVKFPVKVKDSIEGIYTKTICAWTVAVPSVMPDRFNPHAGTYQAVAEAPDALPFNRVFTFSDSDAMNQEMGNDRALQKLQRGQFDSFEANYRIDGHVLNGGFIAPDTMAGLEDSINGIRGPHYVVSRNFHRSKESTTTTIQIRKPYLLRA